MNPPINVLLRPLKNKIIKMSPIKKDGTTLSFEDWFDEVFSDEDMLLLEKAVDQFDYPAVVSYLVSRETPPNIQ